VNTGEPELIGAIPKAGGKVRYLEIATIGDRVAQASVKLVLEPVFEADFLPCSYGFRPNRRAHDAVAEVHHFTSRSYEWIVEGDIEACFGPVADHEPEVPGPVTEVHPSGDSGSAACSAARPGRWPSGFAVIPGMCTYRLPISIGTGSTGAARSPRGLRGRSPWRASSMPGVQELPPSRVLGEESVRLREDHWAARARLRKRQFAAVCRSR
jgi:hypothetical protein